MKIAVTALAFWCCTTASAFAMGWFGGAGSGLGGGGGGGSNSAPEIDGPGGIAAIALLVSVGLIAYNRFRK